MADTFFTNATGATPGTLVVAQWLNDVNTNTYTILASVAGTNTITGTAATTVTVGYPRGVAFRFIPVNTNTGPATINISGLGVKNITKFGTAPLVAGDLIAGSWAYLTYDGTQFQLINAGGPLTGVDTYVTTAGSSTAYTQTFTGSFAFVSGYAVKLIFHATNTSTTPTLNVNGSGVVAMKVMDANGNKIDPIVGAFAINTPATALYDGVNWVVIVEYPTGRLLNVQTFTANGTYTPTPGTTSIVIELLGGGAAGGGCVATGAGQLSIGSGGGAGALVKSRVTSGFSGASVVVGTAGAGVSGASGNNGSASTFLTLSAGGGFGGAASSAASTVAAAGGGGGVGANGNISNGSGERGELTGAAFANVIWLSGAGGNTYIGGGGTAQQTTAATTPGVAASGFGAGGGGAVVGASGAASAGGAGSPGIVVIYEYS